MFIGRENELAWIEKGTRFSSLLILSGIKGIGKTALAKSWAINNQYKIKWNILSNFQPLENFLSADNSNFNVVIWKNIHVLKDENFHLLLNTLKYASDQIVHILLSDEEPKLIAFPDIPHLKLGPFNEEACHLILGKYQEITELPEKIDSKTLFKQTSGIPLLINLFLQSSDFGDNFLNSLLEDTTELQLSILKHCSLLGREFSSNILVDILKVEEEQLIPAITKLRKKYLINNTSNQSYEIPGFIQELVLKNIATTELKVIENNLVDHLFQKSENILEILIHALSAQQKKYVEELLNKHHLKELDPEKLDQYNGHLLKDLCYKIENFYKAISLDNESMVLLLRLELKALFLSGNRMDARDKAEKFLKNTWDQSTFSSNLQKLILDYIQLLNRINLSQETLKLVDKISNKCEGIIKSRLLIEKNVALINSGLDKNVTEASNHLKVIVKELEERQLTDGVKLTLAHAIFQFARSLFHQGKQNEAEEHYTSSAELFSELNLPYFESMALFNTTWIYLKEYRWRELDQVIDKVYPLAEKMGHAFLLSGLSMIKAKKSRFFLQGLKALQLIEDSLRFLGENPPLGPLEDILTEKACILLLLGQYNNAKSLFKEIITIRGEDHHLKSSVQALKLEIECLDLNSEEALERWEQNSHIKDIDDSYERFCLTRGIKVENQNQASYPLLELARSTNNLLHSLEDDPEDLQWNMISQMEELIKYTNCSGEIIALNLLQYSLTDDKNKKVIFLSSAQENFSKWTADTPVKAPLLAWLKSLEGEEKINPTTDTDWQKAPQAEQDKWQHWFSPFYKKQEKGHILITPKGKETIKEIGRIKKRKGICIIEDLGEVWHNGILLEKLNKWHQLRKLLSLLIETYPIPLKKEEIATTIWGEDYNPLIHDTRIYTAIQRLRKQIGLEEFIQSLDTGYQLNARINFYLIRPIKPIGSGNHRASTLIMNALESFKNRGDEWVSRSTLLDATGIHESSLKRELTKLYNKKWIKRTGKGRAVKYSIS